ncbi:MAG: ATP-binding protein [Clostridiales bacterium]|nr:ATP-binding protein [Clostridiales bacterium]
MKLISVKLKNFRGYENIVFHLTENLHMIVGMNDIGKSTILEALDIFFNESNAQSKITVGDLFVKNRQSEDRIISIACEFSIDTDEQVIIDATRQVSPKDEMLLNGNGNLEIKKSWDCSKVTLKTVTEIVCCLPSCIDKSYLSMKNSELKKKLAEIAPTSTANKSVNSEMRKAIYDKLMADNPNSQLEEHCVETKALLEDKDFFPSLEKSLPDYYLFKADRKNTTTDDEVQNPLSMAVKNAMSNDQVKQKLDEIQGIIENELKQINAATIEQMKKFSSRLGNSLIPQINTNWTKAISNDILDGNSIPINKKGSGIRRLLLLSYLMVQAQKTSLQRNKKDIIYAIEEPETSLHPKLQDKFIRELIHMSERADYSTGEEVPSNIGELPEYKVLITTHLPNYLSYATQEQVIYIGENEDGNPVEYIGDIEYHKIKEELGLLPNPYYGYVIFVEGENDQNLLRNLNNIPELREIFDIEKEEVTIIPLQGSRLLKSIEYDFYKELPVKQFHLYDGDVQEYIDYLNNKVIGKNNKWDGVVTSRKCMEYYIPASLIACKLGIDITPYLVQYNNADFSLIDTILDINSQNITLLGIKKQKSRDKQRNSLKAYLNKTAMRGVTKDLLVAFGVYDEVEQWFKKMRDLKERN